MVMFSAIRWEELKTLVSGHDLLRLEKYSKNLADRHLITDLLPHIAFLFFSHRFPNLHLSPVQSVSVHIFPIKIFLTVCGEMVIWLLNKNSLWLGCYLHLYHRCYTSKICFSWHYPCKLSNIQALIAGLGLQLKTFEKVSQELDVAIESVLGQFNRAIRRVLKVMSALQEAALTKHLPKSTKMLADFVPVSISLDQDLEDAAEVSGSSLCRFLWILFYYNLRQSVYKIAPKLIIKMSAV